MAFIRHPGALIAALMMAMPGMAAKALNDAAKDAPDDMPPRKQHRSERGFVAAPVGRNHPDYGLSLEEHLARKAARAKEPTHD